MRRRFVPRSLDTMLVSWYHIISDTKLRKQGAPMNTEIKYNRDTKDFDCYAIVDGKREYIGSAPNYSKCEAVCAEWRAKQTAATAPAAEQTAATAPAAE